jgi:hypothetical protein
VNNIELGWCGSYKTRAETFIVAKPRLGVDPGSADRFSDVLLTPSYELPRVLSLADAISWVASSRVVYESDLISGTGVS